MLGKKTIVTTFFFFEKILYTYTYIEHTADTHIKYKIVCTYKLNLNIKYIFNENFAVESII